MKQPLAHHLRESYSYSNICKLLAAPPEKTLRAWLATDDGIARVTNAVNISLQEKHYRVVVSVATRALAQVPAEWQLVFENLRANALEPLGWTDEAQASARRLLELVDKPHTPRVRIPASMGHNLVAWTAYLADDIKGGLIHARKAADRKNLAAQATLGVLLYAAGEEAEAFEILKKVMAKGVDPEPNATLRADPRYLALCARFGIRGSPRAEEKTTLTLGGRASS
jgi:tetratricopeptide (TPR) repeat protein